MLKYPKQSSDEARSILAEICSEAGDSLSYTDAKDYLLELDDLLKDDFCFNCEGAEYRIICYIAMDEIYEEEIKRICLDCYDMNLPKFFTDNCINWDEVARICLQDGYGHTFSTYDGSELQADGYYIFRTG